MSIVYVPVTMSLEDTFADLQEQKLGKKLKKVGKKAVKAAPKVIKTTSDIAKIAQTAAVVAALEEEDLQEEGNKYA